MGSALDSASLIMYPSGYSDGVLGSAKPTDGSGDFTFTRGSNLSATRVGPNGYIEKGYENLLLQSNSFLTSPWQLQNGADITPNHSGYDGSNDAWYLYKNTGTTSQLIRQSISSTGVQTFSFYAKAEELEWVRFLWIGSTGGRSHFNLVGDGDTGVAQNVISTSIEPIGNDWYKCSTAINDTISAIQIYPAIGDNSVSGSTGGIYIQDAMLNQGLVAYPYIETTTAPVAGGILEDEPRIDFSDGCGHLLLEPSRTNLITDSEYITQPANGTNTYNQGISPEGVNNATKYSATGQYPHIREQVNVVSGNNYCFSFFVKKNDYPYMYVKFNRLFDGTNARIWFDLDSDNISTEGSAIIDADIEDYGNGWYRCWAVSQANGTGNGEIRLTISDRDGIETLASVDTNKYNLIYGLQLEQDATYPTSYIPTYGVSQTRLMDNCSNAGSLVPNNTEGTMFFDFIHGYINAGNSNFVGISGGNRIVMYLPSNSIYGLIQIVDSNGTRYLGTGEIFEKTAYKIAITYNTSEIKLYKNGVLESTTTGIASDFLPSGFSLNALSSIYIHTGQRYNQALLFPTALSDSECIALTTI